MSNITRIKNDKLRQRKKLNLVGVIIVKCCLSQKNILQKKPSTSSVLG